MHLSLNGKSTRHGHSCSCAYHPQSATQLNAMGPKTAMESMSASPKRRWWYFTQDTFTTLAFLPRFLVFLVAALSLLSTFYTSAYYNYPFTITPATSTVQVHLQRKSPVSPATITTPKTRNEAYAQKPNSTGGCRWAQYVDWPYVSQFPGLLSPHRRKLLYVKTPKSSSSTTAHILQRYTSREGLIVGYPNFARNEWTFQTERSLRATVTRRNVSEVDALVSHIIYRRPTVDSVLGISDNAGVNKQRPSRPFRMTSVRDPVVRSWSMYAHGAADPAAFEFKMGANNPMDFARNLDLDGQLNYAAGFKYAVNPPTPDNVARHYDHIVVSERVLESFLTLAPKLGLHASDLLYFSQKRLGYAKKIARHSNITAREKSDMDVIIREKTRFDAQLHRLANERLDVEFRALPGKVRRILGDIPTMMKEVQQVCGKIDPEDNSCLTRDDIMWDGNQMCLARCIQRWADRNIRCSYSTQK